MWMGLCCGLQRKPPAVTDGSPGKTKKKFKGPLSILGNQTVDQKLEMASKTKVLVLSDMGLKSVPGGAFQVEDLKTFDMAHNRLTVVPDALGTLAALKNLHLQHNQLTDVSPLSRLSLLENLDLSNNCLTSLPHDLSFGPRLKYLSLKHNELSVLPPNCFAGAQDSLRSLDLGHNRLADLPP
eukprot:EG_transcript_34202